MSSSLQWFKSYLCNRHQQVIVNNNASSSLAVQNGVPQGSILGPLLFVIMTHDISDVISFSKYHMYADDTQLYTSSKPLNVISKVPLINQDLSAIDSWSKRNALNLNASKCMYIIIGSPQTLKKVTNQDIPSLSINGIDIPRVNACKNLGIKFDTNLSWEPHVNSLISKAFYKLKHLYRSKTFLSIEVKLRLCDSLILSAFNYCDFLFSNMSLALQSKIQRIQNSCLRYSYSIRKYDHISPYLVQSGWLNMSYRRACHGLSLVYKIVHKLVPDYVIEPISSLNIQHSYATRHQHLPVPLCRTSIKSSFFYSEYIKKYNSLPESIKSSTSLSSFKTSIKLYYLSIQNSRN